MSVVLNQNSPIWLFFFFIVCFKFLFIYFGCAESSLLRMGFRSLWCVGFSLWGFSGGAQAQSPHSIWNLPGPGIEPMSPALPGGFLTTGPPGNSGCCSAAKSCPTLQPQGLHHARLPCLSLSPWVCPNSCSLSQLCYLTISSSAAPFSFCLRSFPASGPFLISWLFASGGQNIGPSALATVLLINIQGWFPLGLTSLIFVLSKGLSRAFSSTTIRKHQFFGAQPSLCSNSHIRTWLLEKPSFDYMDLCQQSDVSAF